jgi:hypothetical protein
VRCVESFLCTLGVRRVRARFFYLADSAIKGNEAAAVVDRALALAALEPALCKSGMTSALTPLVDVELNMAVYLLGNAEVAVSALTSEALSMMGITHWKPEHAAAQAALMTRPCPRDPATIRAAMAALAEWRARARAMIKPLLADLLSSLATSPLAQMEIEDVPVPRARLEVALLMGILRQVRASLLHPPAVVQDATWGVVRTLLQGKQVENTGDTDTEASPVDTDQVFGQTAWAWVQAFSLAVLVTGFGSGGGSASEPEPEPEPETLCGARGQLEEWVHEFTALLEDPRVVAAAEDLPEKLAPVPVAMLPPSLTE